MGHEDLCETGLVLGLGCAANVESRSIPNHHHEKASRKFHHRSWMSLEASLTLSLADDAYKGPKKNNVSKLRGEETSVVVRQPSPNSPVSSFSNTCIKREKEGGSEGVELERVSLRVSDEDEDGCVRKKLRLTKEQSALLEDSFKDHSTLNPKQKQELAKRLNLRPRQVEVWFQNRRARTKLKQTEVDCELLKRCCEALKDENRRLQKELQELKAMNFVSPFYMRLPAATLTMCPSCERISSGGGHNKIDLAKNPFPMPSKPHHLYNPFTHSSAAC